MGTLEEASVANMVFVSTDKGRLGCGIVEPWL